MVKCKLMKKQEEVPPLHCRHTRSRVFYRKFSSRPAQKRNINAFRQFDGPTRSYAITELDPDTATESNSKIQQIEDEEETTGKGLQDGFSYGFCWALENKKAGTSNRQLLCFFTFSVNLYQLRGCCVAHACFTDVSEQTIFAATHGSLTDSLCIKAFMSMFKSFYIWLRGSVQEVVQGCRTEGWFSG
ncbi:hypothetical protein CTI12_AA432000 [Artemisia annua]|uniref:Uncharacterized protein n=1 Tax=Artemisia annua TaxID=35608 RepID=A0A2U1M112_ARTAN|nr:hypothetical protein CTI12_AA432000 [Artemisia annua]